MEHEIDDDTNCNWCPRYNHQRIGTSPGTGTSTGTGRRGNKRMCEDHPNYSIIEIGQNTKRVLKT